MRGDPPATRLRHWTRWRRRSASELWRHRAHLDLLATPARAVWLCSWQRSGSTWLAQVLASAPGTRLIYEPANLPHHVVTGEAAALEALEVGPGESSAAVEAALHGRVHGAWVDQLALGHVVRRRVVKDVRGVGFLDVIAARQPTAPIVVLLRHPLSIASSVVQLGWTADPGASLEDQLQAEVARWISLHDAALRSPASARALVVTYEHLVANPDAVLDRIARHLRAAHPTWGALERLDRTQLSMPSATSFRRREAQPAREWIGDFAELPAQAVSGAVEALGRSCLAGIYGEGSEPLVAPDGVDRALASR